MIRTKILAMIVAISMIVAVVPGLAITASAAQTNDVISQLGGTVVWNMPDEGTWGDSPVRTIPGWDSIVTAGNGNLKSETDGRRYFQFYGDNTNNSKKSAVNVTVYSPGYAGAVETLIIEAKFKRSGVSGNNFYRNNIFYDIDGNEIGHAWVDIKQKDFIAENPWGFPNDGDEIALVVTNNSEDNTHTNTWYVNNELKFTSPAAEGIVNGFGSFKVEGAGQDGDNWWWHSGFTNLTIGVVETDTVKTITATYKVDDETVATVEGMYDSKITPEGYTFPEYVYSDSKNDVYHATGSTVLLESGDIAVEKAERNATHKVGEALSDNGENYVVTGENVVVNGNFITGDAQGWTNRRGNAHHGAIRSVHDKVKTENVNGVDTNVLYAGEGGADDLRNLGQNWALESDTTYYVSFDIANLGGTYASLVPSDSAEAAIKAAEADISKDDSDLIKTWADNADWVNYHIIHTATGETPYLTLALSWMDNAKIANPEILPVKKITSVKEEINAEAKVIEGNEPVLPQTVTVVLEDESEQEVAVEWKGELTPGEEPSTLTAYVAGTELEAGSATVTVLPLLLEIDDVSSYSMISNWTPTKTFHPIKTGEFVVEMDLTWNKFTNDQVISISNAAALKSTPWGTQQIQLGTNDQGVFTANSRPNSNNESNNDNKTVQLPKTGTYRLLIESNTSDYSYSVRITAIDGSFDKTLDGMHYRNKAGVENGIDSFWLFTNGSDNGGNMTASNIKIYAKDLTDSKVTTTVNFKSGEDTVAQTEIKGVAGDAYNYEQYALVNGTDGSKYYVTETVSGSLENSDPIDVNVTKTNDVYTIQGGKAYVGDNVLNVAGTTGLNSFCAYNWENGYDRIGIAIIDVPERLDNATYNITADTYRYGGNAASTTNIAAISLEDYAALDISDTAAVYAKIQDANMIAKGTGTNSGDSSTLKDSFTIDADKLWAAAGETGKAVLIGSSTHCLYGLSNDLRIVPTPVDVTPALGWNNGEFTVDFLFGEGTVDGVTYNVKVFNAAAEAAIEKDVAVSESVNGVAVEPASTNAIYSAKMDGGKTSDKVSVYSLVMKTIAEQFSDGASVIAAEQLDKVNEVLKDGGLYLINDKAATDTLNYKLTDEVKGVLKLAAGSDENTLVVTIEDNASTAGLSFKNAGTVTTIENATAAIAEDGKSVTITLDGALASLAENIFLEEIEFVFAPEVADDNADETVSGELDFVEEV